MAVKKDKHNSKYDISQVGEYIFVGTNLCCLDKPHLEILKDMNADVVVDLEEKKQDIPPKVKIYLWLPTPDHGSPTMKQFDAGVAVIEAAVKNKQRVYVHCMYGHGRSPAMVAAYFIKTGKSVSEAIKEIRDNRAEIHIESLQMKGLEEYEKWCKKKS